MKTQISNSKRHRIPAAGAIALVLSQVCISAWADPATISKLELDPRPPLREGALGGYSSIVEEVSPSVVSIISSRFEADPYAGRYGRSRDARSNPQPQGLGSGVILTSDGFIVTNRHVVAGADEVKVALGKRSDLYDAVVIGADEATDIAVLKIDATGLAAAKLGDSRTLKAGDFVLAIGSPFGLLHTVTTGIVSALERDDLGLTGQFGYENFIQTDASINPGNSGGALVDNRGRVIGINTAIFSKTGGNDGIGFAIPTDLAVGIARQFIEQGEVHRGFLGVVLGDITQELAKTMNIDRDGAIVHELAKGSPADKGGIASGDVITTYGDRVVPDSAKLRLMVGGTRPGTTVEFEVIRDGKPIRLKVIIGGQNPGRPVASNGILEGDETVKPVSEPRSGSVSPRHQTQTGGA